MEYVKAQFAKRGIIIDRVKVGVTPGIDFGSGGEGYIRFSYANSIENIARGLDRVEAYLKERGHC